MTFPAHTLNNYVVDTTDFQKFGKNFGKKSFKLFLVNHSVVPALGTIAARGINTQKEVTVNVSEDIDDDVFEVSPIYQTQYVIYPKGYFR